MMFSYPYFGMPSYSRYSRYGYRYPCNPYAYHSKDTITQTPSYHQKENVDHVKKQNHREQTENSTPNNAKEDTPKQENHSGIDFDSPLFQILGISLYFDDILILCLIFFLYQEGVKDQSLFISLILLLLS